MGSNAGRADGALVEREARRREKQHALHPGLSARSGGQSHPGGLQFGKER